MKKLTIYFLLCIFCLSCVSPQKRFEKGQYNKAFSAALNELEERKDVRKNRNILNRSFEAIVERNETEKARLFRSGLVEDRVRVYESNEALIELFFDGKTYLDEDWNDRMIQLDQDNKSLRSDIADFYFQEGKAQLDQFNVSGDKFLAQEAYVDFELSDKYSINVSNLDSLMESAYLGGQIHILVETEAWDLQYRWKIDNAFRRLVTLNRPFLKLHYENMISIADCRIDLMFNDIEFNDTRDVLSQNFSKDIQDGYTTLTDSLGNSKQVPKYIKIEGVGKTHITNRTYNWRARSTIRRMTPYCGLNEGQFQADYTVSKQRYSYSGDARAVPDKYKDNRDRDFEKDKDRVVEKMIEEIYRDFVQFYFK